MKKFISLYSIVVGISMIGMWSMFYLSNKIPELATKPFEIAMHLSAEFFTAILLVISGIGILAGRPWGNKLNLLALGMLLYTVIVNPGYYLQRHEIPFVLMFATLFALTVCLSAFSTFKKQI